MAAQPEPLTDQDRRAILSVCILAAFADGTQNDGERTQIERVLKGFSDEHLDLASAYQDVLSGKIKLADVASQLTSPSAKALAYEMAVCVCNADGVLQDSEKKFLADLRSTLGLDPTSTEPHQQQAQALALQPVAGPVPPVIKDLRQDDIEHVILNTSILTGALEIMPHTLATMAIVPLQMRMVYQIGKRYGFDLDRTHIAEFLGTVGIGLTSQVFEGFARRMVKGFTRRVAGGLLGGLAGEAAGSAVAFATTYALGHVAQRYYSSGRTLTAAQLQDVFTGLLSNARSMQGQYSGQILQQSRQVNVPDLLRLVRSS